MNEFRLPSFDQHAEQQRERELAKTPAEGLAWLWQALLFALSLQAHAWPSSPSLPDE